MSINLNLDLEVDELVSGCRRRDKTKLLRCLLKNMDNDDIMSVVRENHNEELITFRASGFADMRVHEGNFNQALFKLSNNYITLTIEDQTIIENIANKF
jgi:hypothetical protein